MPAVGLQTLHERALNLLRQNDASGRDDAHHHHHHHHHSRVDDSQARTGRAINEAFRDVLLRRSGPAPPAPTPTQPDNNTSQKPPRICVDYAPLFERSTLLIDELAARHVKDNVALRPEERARRAAGQRERSRGEVIYQQILDDLNGFRDAEGRRIVFTEQQLETIILIINNFLPLIFDEEYDRNPEAIRKRYGAVVNAIMAILMPRKYGKTSLLCAVYAVMMMNMHSFTGTNVSVTLPQARLLTSQLWPFLRNHVRCKSDFPTPRKNKDRIELTDYDGDVRVAEVRASRVTGVAWRVFLRVCVWRGTSFFRFFFVSPFLSFSRNVGRASIVNKTSVALLLFVVVVCRLHSQFTDETVVLFCVPIVATKLRIVLKVIVSPRRRQFATAMIEIGPHGPCTVGEADLLFDAPTHAHAREQCGHTCAKQVVTGARRRRCAIAHSGASKHERHRGNGHVHQDRVAGTLQLTNACLVGL